MNISHALPIRWSTHSPPYRVAGVLELRDDGTFYVEGSPHAAAMPCNLNIRGSVIRKNAGTDEFISVQMLSEKFIVGYFGNKWVRVDVVDVPPVVTPTEDRSPTPPQRPLLRPRPMSLRPAPLTTPQPEPEESKPNPVPEEPKPKVAESPPPPVLPPFSVRKLEEPSERPPLQRLAGWLNGHGFLVGVICIGATLAMDTIALFATRKKETPAAVTPASVRMSQRDTEYRSVVPATGRILSPYRPRQALPNFDPADRSPTREWASR